ncbi:thermonuclease family protein [Mucilaginibacter terrenus]|nr:thermonuclease family protein [Mucilaginibacter terrenus]
MLKKAFISCLFLVLLITACNRREETLYKVVKIKDGDTMELLSPDHQNITVRLAEIDCPEKSQAFGQAAKQFTSDLCFGKYVKLVENNKDRYGRTVGQVLLEDGTNVNYSIVKNGYAWQYRAYSKDMELAMLEQSARQNRLGLWQDANPTPPWNFRRNEKAVRKDTTDPNTRPKRHYKKRRKHYQPQPAL